MNKIKIFADAAQVADAAAQIFAEKAIRTCRDRGRFSAALSGGSTPRMLFTRLAQKRFAEKIPWDNVHLFWGDERTVAPDHPMSNYGMAREHLLAKVPIPKDNIHRIEAELDPHSAARQYETLLRGFFDILPEAVDSTRAASFDLVFLGMGDDGHTASLFPGTAALKEFDRKVVANYVGELGTWRITLTATEINHAALVVFLVTGEAKQARLKDVLQGPYRPDDYPAQLIRPTPGELLWLVDRSAAALLDA